jgi:hypothetical protein
VLAAIAVWILEKTFLGGIFILALQKTGKQIVA